MPQFHQLGRKLQGRVGSEEKRTPLYSILHHSLPSRTWFRQGKVLATCRRHPGLGLPLPHTCRSSLSCSTTFSSHSLIWVIASRKLNMWGEISSSSSLESCKKQPKWEQQVVPSFEICSAHCTHIRCDLSLLRWSPFPQSPSDSVFHHLHYEGWALSLCNKKICHSNSSCSSFWATASQKQLLQSVSAQQETFGSTWKVAHYHPQNKLTWAETAEAVGRKAERCLSPCPI